MYRFAYPILHCLWVRPRKPDSGCFRKSYQSLSHWKRKITSVISVIAEASRRSELEPDIKCYKTTPNQIRKQISQSRHRRRQNTLISFHTYARHIAPQHITISVSASHVQKLGFFVRFLNCDFFAPTDTIHGKISLHERGKVQRSYSMIHLPAFKAGIRWSQFIKSFNSQIIRRPRESNQPGSPGQYLLRLTHSV